MLNYQRFRSCFVDSRLGVQDMVESVLNRLAFFNVKVIYEPVQIFPYGIPSSFKQILHPTNLHRNLNILQGTNQVLPFIRWRRTNCGIFCPIQKYYGFLKRGKIEFAVRFLSFTYLCYNEICMKKLITFPKKYIFERLPCRIAIIGCTKVGKTTLAKLFHIIYNCEIYNMKQQVPHLTQVYSPDWSILTAEAMKEASELAQSIHEEYFMDKQIYHEFLQNMITEIISSIIDVDKVEELVHIPDEHIPERYHFSLYEFLFQQILFEKYRKKLVKTNVLVNDFVSWIKLKEISTEPRKVEWIIDDAPLDSRFWEKLPKEYLPNMVIFLTNSSEAKYFEAFTSKLNDRFCNWKKVLDCINDYYDYCPKFNSNNHYDFFKPVKNFRNDQILKEYSNFLASRETDRAEDLELNFEDLKDVLKKREVEFIDFDIAEGKNWPDCNDKILHKYFFELSNFFDDFSKHFFKTYELPTNIEDLVQYSEENIPESTIDEEESHISIELANQSYIEKNFGHTLEFCPVTFLDEQFLVKGFSKYGIVYRSNIYFMHNQKYLEKFKQFPSKYSYRESKPIPPSPAIFVIGINHGQKRAFASLLTEELKVRKYTYQKLVERYYLDYDITDDVTIEGQTNIFEIFGRQFIEKELKNLFQEKGFILTGYPFLSKQFEVMIKNRIFPEAIFVTDDKSYLTTVLHDIINTMLLDKGSKRFSSRIK